MVEQQSAEVRTVSWWRFPGWQMVGAAMIQGFIGYGFWIYSWSTFVPIFRKQFGWSAAEIGISSTIGRVGGGIEGPLVGWILDKWGPRVTAISGLILCVIGWIVIANTQGGPASLWYLYVGYGLLTMLGMNISLYTTSFPAVNRWFVRRRANAMGVIAVGAGMGASVLIPITQAVILTAGYQAAAYMIAAVTTFIAIPLGLLFRPHPPEHYGFRPDNQVVEVAQSRPGQAAGVASSVQLVDFTLYEAVRTLAFWGLVVGGSLAGVGAMALPLFQNERMQAIGFDPQAAANIYSLENAMTVVGRLAVAILGETIDPYLVNVGTTGLLGIGMLFFALGSEAWHFYTWAVIFGVPYGAWVSMIGALRGSYFGRAHQGKIYGWINAGTATGGFAAPVLMGWLVDVHGYRTAFLSATGFYALAAVVAFIARRPRRQPSPGAIKRGLKEAQEALAQQAGS